MTHSFKLSRLRVPVVAALILFACTYNDSFTPTSSSSSETLPRQTSAAAATTTTSCLGQAGPLVTLTGNQKTFDDRKTAVSNLRIDASRASWSGISGFPVHAGNGKSSNLCWHGGTVTGPYSRTTSWSTYHSSAGLFMAGPGLKVEDVTVDNFGDAIRIEDWTDNWTLRRLHVITAHDDCVEDDRLYGGLIEDALFEGCYVFLSERAGGGVKIPVDGRSKTVTIQNTLVYLKPMPTVYKGTAPGTGPLFKWSALGSKLVINNTIFRVDQKPSHGDLSIPPGLGTCSNNVIVWLGSGRYPASLPACFKVTTDKSVWDQAVAGWRARHS